MVLCLKARESRPLPGLPSAYVYTLRFQAGSVLAPATYSTMVPSFRLERAHAPTRNVITAGWSSPVARQAHNLKVAGSNPAPATIKTLQIPLSSWMAVFLCPEIVS